MGNEGDTAAVVDSRARVRETKRLKPVDAAAFPL